jgi:hypothetical protein
MRVRTAPCLAALCAALAAPPVASAVPVPPQARAVDTSRPDRWVGTGTRASCTSRAVVRAVAKGGVIRFRCGPGPVRIEMRQTAKVVNTSRRVVLDGRGRVTLAGGGGGAIFARGGRLKIVRSRFAGNRCDAQGPDLGGAAVRALSQSGGQPVYVVRSTFTRGVCSNGAALSSIGVSWSIFNSAFIGNRAIGRGANPTRPGTAGGGSGGAVYADGNRFRVLIAGTRMTGNRAREGGGAIFFVSNDRSGSLEIRASNLRANPSERFETDPGIFFLGRRQTVVRSVVR